MKDLKKVLIIGTYGIDIFYRVDDQLEANNYSVLNASTRKTALKLIKNWRFDFIIINIEPDGRGNIAEVDLLSILQSSSLQQDAICLGVSLHYPRSLSKAKSERYFHVLAGWLTLPIDADTIAYSLNKMIVSPRKLGIKDLMHDQKQLALAQ
mgnify:CR=1 FL=1